MLYFAAFLLLLFFAILHTRESFENPLPPGETGTFLSKCDAYLQADNSVTHHCILADGSTAVVKGSSDVSDPRNQTPPSDPSANTLGDSTLISGQ